MFKKIFPVLPKKDCKITVYFSINQQLTEKNILFGRKTAANLRIISQINAAELQFINNKF
jgi:phage gp36-like protein